MSEYIVTWTSVPPPSCPELLEELLSALVSLNRQYWLLLRTPGFLYRTPTAECLLCAG